MNEPVTPRQSDARWRLAAARDASDHAAENFLRVFGVVLAVALVLVSLLLVAMLSGCDSPSNGVQACAKSCREGGKAMVSYVGGSWNSGACACGDAAQDGGK